MHAPASIPARIVNRALAQEDGLRAKLAAHAGSAFRIACGPADASLAIDADGALHEAEADVVPALTLTMRARDVPTLLHDPSRFDALVRADVQRDHLDQDAGPLGHLGQVIELLRHYLPATDGPAQGVLVNDHPQQRRVSPVRSGFRLWK